MLPTANILERTFYIRPGDPGNYANTSITCFTIDVGDRQYIITSSLSIDPKSTIQIQRHNSWKDLTVNLVGHTDDITVLAPDRQLSPTHPLPAVTKDVALGQDILFLGFPFTLVDRVLLTNKGFPIPLVKRGIVSALQFSESSERKLFLLDGHTNPGFFGGPVVCEIANSQSKGLGVIGIISAISFGDYNDPVGIIFASDIKHALDLINKNPIGFELPTP